jgi:glycosyltransferase involved in cell wall biosynthesis
MAGSRLKVLQMLPALEGGGVEQGTLEIASALQRAGHDAMVMSAGGAMVSDLENLGAQHLTWPVGTKSPLTLALVPRLRRWLREQNVDVVHARSRVPAWVAWYALKGMPVRERPRFVTTVHGFYRVGRYSAIMTRGERVICVSSAIRAYVTENYPAVPTDSLVTIPRGLDHTQFTHGYRPDSEWQAAFRESLGAPGERKLLLLPGRITRRKGHEVFLQLIADLSAGGLDVHGVVAGGEDPRRRAYAESLYQQVSTLGIDARVTFLGKRKDIREIMATCDLVLSLSSKPESFGRTVLEALSLGRPTLGLDHGGVGEILAALYPPGAVPPGDPETLLQRVRTLLLDPPPVPAEQLFPLEQMQRDTLAVYQSLAGPAQADNATSRR